jgi:hypothetical protein
MVASVVDERAPHVDERAPHVDERAPHRVQWVDRTFWRLMINHSAAGSRGSEADHHPPSALPEDHSPLPENHRPLPDGHPRNRRELSRR